MTDTLEKLFGSSVRVKLLRLFLFNPKQSFTVAEASVRARAGDAAVRKEVGALHRVGVVSARRAGKAVRFIANPRFSHAVPLRELLLNTQAREADLVRRLRSVGSVRLIVISGVFLGEWESSLDLLVVGDKVSERNMRERMRSLEAELGREIRYALFATQDFFYRFNMSDKLLRDMLDYPHTILFDRLNIGLK